MATTAVGGTFWRSPGWPNPVWIHDNAPYLCAAPYKLGEMLRTNVPPIEMRSPGARPPAVNWNNGGLAGMGIISTTVGPGGNGSGLPGDYFSMPGFSSAPTGSGGGGTMVPSSSYAPGPIAIPLANPVFFDVNGNVITQAVCGSVYSMTVPGYEGQWLMIVQTKNGAPSFTGPMLMPMSNYASKCSQDEGSYNVQAFTQAGQLLGSTTFVVLPAASSPGTGPSGLPPLTSATGTPPASTARPAAAPGTTSSTSALPATSVTAPPVTSAAAAPSFLSSLSTTDWLLLVVLGVVVLYQASKR